MINRATYYYRPRRTSDAALRHRIKEIAHARVRYGYQRIYVLLRREGWPVNHKKVHRLYKDLSLRLKRPKRRVSIAHRLERPEIEEIDQCWSMDFVSDQLYSGRRLRALTIVDNFSRECMSIEVEYSLKAGNVVWVLDRIYALTGRLPKRIQVDQGSEFVSKVLDKWAYERKVTLDFSRRGKPTDNAMIESFNGSFRDECLNVNWFLSLEDAKEKIEAWRCDYNDFRPHSSLENLTPNQFTAYHANGKNDVKRGQIFKLRVV